MIRLEYGKEYNDKKLAELSKKIENAIWEVIKDSADNGQGFDWEVSYEEPEEEE